MHVLVTSLRTGLVCSLLAGFSVANATPTAPLLSAKAPVGDITTRLHDTENPLRSVPVDWPASATEWSGVSDAFLARLVQTKLARAARTAYLEAEAGELGAVVSGAAGADDVEFTRSGGLVGDFKLVLLGGHLGACLGVDCHGFVIVRIFDKT